MAFNSAIPGDGGDTTAPSPNSVQSRLTCQAVANEAWAAECPDTISGVGIGHSRGAVGIDPDVVELEPGAQPGLIEVKTVISIMDANSG
jgi:hypothetical protein